MKKALFKFLNKVNKRLLPRLYKKDPSRLKPWERIILAYKYYILTRSLD